MVSLDEVKRLRECIRILERKLGALEGDELSCCGLTLAQCHALVEIGRAERISLSELADSIGLDASTMSRTVNNLVTKRMAQRELDETDRRYVTISLTEQGHARFLAIESGMEAYFLKIYESIAEDEREGVLNSLSILLRAIETGCC